MGLVHPKMSAALAFLAERLHLSEVERLSRRYPFLLLPGSLAAPKNSSVRSGTGQSTTFRRKADQGLKQIKVSTTVSSGETVRELPFALALVQQARAEAAHRGGRIKAIRVKLGPLAGVTRESLEFAYRVACDGTPFEGSVLIIEEAPLRVFCADCGMERPAVSARDLACSVCGAVGPQVIGGDEMELAALEWES
jgi:hydrogenase nickel incorporation protein HypA/HybF